MPFLAKANVSGLGPILRRLDALGKGGRKKVTRAIVTAGGRAVAKQAKKLAPRETGLLRKSMGSKVKVYAETGVAVAIVGPRVGYRQPVVRKRNRPGQPASMADPVKYAHLVELGTRRHAARPFLVPALAAGSVRAAMEKAALAGIERELARGQ